MSRPTVPPKPNQADYPNLRDHTDALIAYNDANNDAILWDQLAAAGARTVDCEHNYGWRDSCPVCD